MRSITAASDDWRAGWPTAHVSAIARALITSTFSCTPCAERSAALGTTGPAATKLTSGLCDAITCHSPIT